MKKEGRILYLSYDGLSDHIGQSQVMPYLIACRRRGIPITVMTFEKKQKKELVEKIAAILQKEDIEWHYVSFSEGGNLSKLNDFLKFIWGAIRISRKKQYKIIHARSYTAGTTGLFMKFLLGKKLVFDKRDFWIDAKTETGRLVLSRFSHRIIHSVLRFFERKLFLRSDHIISLTEKAKQVVLEKYPQRKPGDITVIPCCVDLDLFNPAKIDRTDQVKLKGSLGLSQSYILGYVGSIGTTYMIPELLTCFKSIKAKIPGAALLFLVNNDKEEVFKLVEEANVPMDAIRVASAPRNLMPLYISILDCGIYFITPTYAKQATSPTKLSELLALGKNVITNKGVGDVEKIFSELDCGYLITDFSESEYVKAAQWLLQHQERSRKFDLSHYSLDYGEAQYLKVYRKLLEL